MTFIAKKHRFCKFDFSFIPIAIRIIGYIHQLSPVKQSQHNNPYFDMKMQTDSQTVRTVQKELQSLIASET
jgi:hypothetical protein